MPTALFDIDGTLTASNAIDSTCFADAFRDVFGISIDTDCGSYEHTTDRGIAIEALRRAGRAAHEFALTRHRTRFIELLDQRMTSLAEIPAGGAATDTIVSFGDAPWDVRAAANLGLPFIGIGDKIEAAEVFADYRDAAAIFAAIAQA